VKRFLSPRDSVANANVVEPPADVAIGADLDLDEPIPTANSTPDAPEEADLPVDDAEPVAADEESGGDDAGDAEQEAQPPKAMKVVPREPLSEDARKLIDKAGLTLEEWYEAGANPVMMRLLSASMGGGQAPSPANTPQPNPATPGLPAAPAKPDAFELALGEDQFTPEGVAGAVKSAVAHTERRYQAVAQQLQQVTQQFQQFVQEAQLRDLLGEIKQFDSVIGGFGKHWEDVLGSGPTAALQKDSTAWKARDALFREARDFRSKMLARGQVIDLDDAVRRMAKVLWNEQGEQEVRQQTLDTLKKAQGATVNRPLKKSVRSGGGSSGDFVL